MMGERIWKVGWAVLGGVAGGTLAAVLTAAYLWWAHAPLRFIDQGALYFPIGALVGTLAGAIVARKAGIWLLAAVPLGFIAGNFAAMVVFFTLRAFQEHFFPISPV